MDKAAEIVESLDALAREDAPLAAVISRIGYPAPRAREKGFATLLATIVSQQLSVKAAASIMARLQALMNDAPSAEQLSRLDDSALRAAGLSRQKLGYARDLADAVLNRRLCIDRLDAMDDEAAIAAITTVRGLGRWSAEIYLMFAHARADIWPADDLALQVAVGRLRALPDRPSAKQCRELAAPWQPYRSAAALMMWHYYGSSTLD